MAIKGLKFGFFFAEFLAKNREFDKNAKNDFFLAIDFFGCGYLLLKFAESISMSVYKTFTIRLISGFIFLYQ